jgi:bifunctional DNA-binding transcriptional regulator/antitoxin component of YhaV-PrlF toxin-antitoxin module
VIKTLSTPIVVPEAVRRKAGLRRGDQIEFRVSGRAITILPKVPNVDDEYTPAQRRVIDARLARGEQDIEAGRVHGPFTAKEASAFIEGLAKKRATQKTTRSRR